MDVIVNLPKLNGYTQMWVMADRFTEMVSLIPLKDDAKQLKDLAKLFVSYIWYLNRLPSDIVSDGERRFNVLQ
jgi:hypothetical protein